MSRSGLRYALLAGAGLLFGCAEIAERGNDATTLPKQLRARQVVVTLAKETTREPQATAEALSLDHRLRATGSFPLDTIDVQCVVFDVPSERPLDEVIEELESDPRVESV